MEEIERKCSYFLENINPESIDDFSKLVSELPSLISSSKESFSENLNFLLESQFFKAVNSLFSYPISIDFQHYILRLWDFLFQTSNCEKDYKILFTDNVTNLLLLYAFDLSNTEILQEYATVMKGISLKLKDFDNDLLLYKGEIPLITHSFPFINFKDSITVSAVRFVVLNLCLAKNLEIQSALMDSTVYAPFENLINSIDQDGCAFIGDLLDIAPLHIKEFVINCLREKLRTSNFRTFATCLPMLASTGARSMIMYLLEEFDPKKFLKNSTSLSIFLYALEKKLFTIDFALKNKLFSADIPSFGTKTENSEELLDLGKEFKILFAELRSPQKTALILEIYRELYNNLQDDVYQQRRVALDYLYNNYDDEIIRYIIDVPMKERTDIDSVLKQGKDVGLLLDKPVSYLLQVYEMEHYLAKMNGGSFTGYELSHSDDTEEERFTTQSQKEVIVNANEIIIGKETFQLNKCYIKERRKRNVKICSMPEKKSRRDFFIPSSGEIVEIEFESSYISKEFEKYVNANQCKLIRTMFNNLLQ